MRGNITVWLFVLSATLSPLTARAVPITVPPSLSAGQPYRLAFVTSSSIDATSSDIDTYNTFVTNVATSVPQLAALSTTWKVIGSTASVNARDNTATPVSTPNIPIFLLDGTRFAADYQSLWTTILDQTLHIQEDGTTAPSSAVWTGSDPSGVVFDNGGFGPVEGLGSIGGPPIYGANNSFFTSWMTVGSISASTEFPVFAMSGVLTVPEPSTFALLGFGLAALIFLRRRAG